MEFTPFSQSSTPPPATSPALLHPSSMSGANYPPEGRFRRMGLHGTVRTLTWSHHTASQLPLPLVWSWRKSKWRMVVEECHRPELSIKTLAVKDCCCSETLADYSEKSRFSAEFAEYTYRSVPLVENCVFLFN